MSNNLIPSTSAGGFSTTGNIAGNYFVGNGSQLTGITSSANTANLSFYDTTMYVAANTATQYLTVSYNGEGWAYLSIPSDATANTVPTRLHNDSGNVEIGSGTNPGGNTYSWSFGNDGAFTLPSAFGPGSGAGYIQTANAYPTILAYGSGGHGGPELDWANTDSTSNLFGNSEVLRHTMYLNSEGLYVGFNENGVPTIPTPNWSFDPTGNLNLPQGGWIGAAGVKGDGTMLTGGPGQLASLTSFYSDAPDMYSSCVTVNPDGTLNITTYGNGTGMLGQWTFAGTDLTAPGNISVAGNIYGNLQGIASTAITVTSNAQPNITSVGLLNALTVNGNIVVTGNANVQGTLTYNNINQLTTSNLVLGLGNNQTGINVTGGGIEVGQTGEASLFYCQPNHVWDSNIGISAVGNILSGRTISAVGNILSGGAITAIGNISGNFFIGNGSLLTGLTATPTFGNTIAIGTGTGNAQGTFAVAIGVNAGFNSQQGYAVAIGACTGGGNNAYNSNVVTFAGSTFVSVVGAINTNFTWQPGQTMTAPPTVVGAKIVRTFINNSGSGQGRLELSQPATGNSSGIAGTAVGHQQGYAVAIGGGAGSLNQCTNSIAIGHCAGATGQCNNSIAIGAQAGSEKQGANSVAVGRGAGNWRQSSGAVAIGTGAGAVYQGANAIAIGFSSGNGVSATANATIVRQCGASTNRFSLTGTGSVGPLYAGMQFIGNPLAFSTPSLCTPVYITCVAGNNTFTTNYIGQTINAFKYNFVKNTGQKSIAIGACAGNAIGNSSIAIGAGAGNLFLANNSIVINATGANLTSNVANALFVAPVRCATVAGGSPVGLGYCTTTKEVVYGVGGGGGGCYGNSNVATYLASGTVSTGILTTVGISAQGGLAFGALNNCIHCECGAIISSPMGILLQSCNLGTSALLFNNQLSVTGNIIGTNLNTTGLVSATGNVYGCNVVGTYLYGCGANITGISSNSISNGTSNVSIATANGAITMAVNGTSAGKIDLSRVAIGHMAGECSQGPGAIAIGDSAGTVNQAGCAVAIGSLTAGGSNASNDNVSTTTGSSIVKLTGTTTGAWQVGQTMTTPAAVVGAKVIRYIDNPFTGSFLILSKNATATVAGVVGSATGYQQANTVAVGTQAGSQNQNVCSVAIGVGAGQLGQLCKAIAIGTSAGQSVQGTNSIAIGCGAGQLCQQTKAIAVGTKAGSILQGQGSIAIGCGAGGGIESLFTASLNPCSSCWTWYGGCTSEVVPTPGMILTSLPPCNSVTTWPFNTYPVTITSYCQSPCGPSFGGTFTTDAISGPQCGIPYCGVWPFIKGTGANAIAIGTNAGNAQGNNSIAIGHAAGNYLLGNNSIVINATGANLTSGCGVSCALYIAPIRSAVVAGGSPLGVGYCITTKEIVYDPASARAAVYDAATARGITGTAGQMIAITNSPVHAGRIAYWDLTNTRWSYISDNTAV